MGSKGPPQHKQVTVMIPTGFGLNCEAETSHAFRLAGAQVQQMHFNDLAQAPERLAHCQILALVGGFSFGDHLGAGRVFANRLRTRLGDPLQRFIADGGLVLGICNGFQTMVRLGLLPGGAIAEQRIALAENEHGAFYDGWIDLTIDPQSPCIYTRGLETLSVPVRHGEGRILGEAALVEGIIQQHLAPVRYMDPKTLKPTQTFPENPNGSIHAIAGLCDQTGRLFGLMPHPEAFLYPENHPGWRRRPRLSDTGDGLMIFRNAVEQAI